MKFGVYNAILHDRSLSEAIEVIAKLGLTGIELNSGGFLPALHIPTFDDILTSDTARDDFLGQFEGTGVEIAGLNCNGNPLHPDPVIGSKHAEDVRRSIRLANRLGQHRVITMSGPTGIHCRREGRTHQSGCRRLWRTRQSVPQARSGRAAN
jgi:sugar phosphate isomerase/epimerase